MDRSCFDQRADLTEIRDPAPKPVPDKRTRAPAGPAAGRRVTLLCASACGAIQSVPRHAHTSRPMRAALFTNSVSLPLRTPVQPAPSEVRAQATIVNVSAASQPESAPRRRFAPGHARLGVWIGRKLSRQLAAQSADPLAGLVLTEPREELVCELDVVAADLGAVVEDRQASLRRLRVADRPADDRFEHL